MSSQAGTFFYCSKGTKVTKRFLGFPNQFETKVTFLPSWQTDCSQHTKSRRPPRWRWAKKLQLAQSTGHRAADGSIGNTLNYSFIKTTATAHSRTQGLETSLYYYILKNDQNGVAAPDWTDFTHCYQSTTCTSHSEVVSQEVWSVQQLVLVDNRWLSVFSSLSWC